MMQASISGATTLPSLESEESVTLQSLNGQGLGFDISANDDGSFTIDDVKSDGVAGVSGRIKPGDRLTDIGIDLSKLKPDDAPKLLKAIAAFPVKYSIKKHGSRSANLDAGLKLDAPKFDIGINGLKEDLTVPEGKHDIGFAETGPSIACGTALNLPDISAEVNGTSKGGVDINLPQVEIDHDGVELSGGKTGSIGSKLKGFFSPGSGKKDKHGKGKGKIEADVSIPTVEFKSGKISENIDASIKPGDVKLSLEKPKVDIDVQEPSVEGDLKVKAPKADGERWFDKHKPKIGLGKSGKYSVSDASADIDVDVPGLVSHPSVGIEGKINNPDIIDRQTAEVDIGIERGKGNAGLRGSAEAELPHVNDIKRSKGSGGIHFALPRLSFKSKSAKADSKIAEKGLHGGVESSVKGSVSSPDADINIESPLFDQSPEVKVGKKSLGGKMKGYFAGPGKKTGKTNGIAAIDVDIPETDINVEVKEIKPVATIDGEVDAHLPDVDVKGKQPKASGGFGIKMPSLDFKGKGPKVDVDIGADASLPSGKIEGEVDADLPDVNLKGEKHKGSGGFGINLPSVDLKGMTPKFGVDIGGDASLPSGNIGGEIDADLPEVKVKGEKPKGSGGFGIKLPSVDLKATGPKANAEFGADVSIPSGNIEGEIDADLPDIKVKGEKPKGSGGFGIKLPTFDLKATGPKADVDFGGDGKVDAGLSDIELKGDKPKASGGIDITLPSFDLKGKGEKGNIDMGADISGPSGRLESPSVESERLEVKSDKRSSLGRKVKGLFSSKGRPSSPKADVGVVSLGVSGDKSAMGAAVVADVSPSGAHADLKTGKDGECGFATSYDVGLHQEAAIDVPSSPSISAGGEAAAESSSPASDNERSMLHDENGRKFRVRIGSGKSSKGKTGRKKRPRIEDGLRSGLATELIASAGRVQLPEQHDKC